MDALVIVVIAVAVLMGLIGLGVVAGSGRARRMDERRIHAEEVRREAEFQDARAEQARADAEERMARARREEADEVNPAEQPPPPSRRFERHPEGEEVPPEAAPEQLPGPRDDR